MAAVKLWLGDDVSWISAASAICTVIGATVGWYVWRGSKDARLSVASGVVVAFVAFIPVLVVASANNGL